MPHLAIDCRFASLNVGIGRYTREIVREVVKINAEFDLTLLVKNEAEDWIQELDGSHSLSPTPYPHYSLQEQALLPGILKKLKADLFFVPHFNAPLFCSVPFVSVVHDLILHFYPNQASLLKRMAYRLLMNHTLAKAERVIAVSKVTADDICAQYPTFNESKLTVVDEGVSDIYHPRSPEEVATIENKYSIQKPYILYVGGAKEHKNVQVLIGASRGLDVNLVLVTGGREVENLSLNENVTILSNVPDEDLPALYSGAESFVTASLYEGYCLPAVEALACECPVIAPNTGSIPEVTKGFAQLVDPTEESFRGALQSLPDRPSGFTSPKWYDAAQNILSILKESIT